MGINQGLCLKELAASVKIKTTFKLIFNCFEFKKLILTASGGAFRNFSKEQIKTLKASEALKHPNWMMGQKILLVNCVITSLLLILEFWCCIR